AVEGEAGADFKGGVYMTTGMLDYTAAPEWWQIGAVEGIPTCMAYSKDANYLWVGTLEGRLFRLSNIARAYNKANADITSPGCIIANTEITLSTTQAITSIAVDAKNPENVVFTLGNYGNADYIFSTKEGMMDIPTFESVQGNLPAMPVYASSFEVNNEGLVVIGTENGLFSTLDIDGSSVEWMQEEAPFGNVPVFSIKQQDIDWGFITYPVNDNFNEYKDGANNYGAFYVGTFGAGAYITRSFVGFEEFDTVDAKDSKLDIYPNPASQMARISFESFTQGMVSLEIYDLSGKLIIDRKYSVNKGQTTIDVNLFNLDNGSYIVRVMNANKQYQSKLVITK
ncbi:MAG: T9SS type A sorting domain-containing protein, partial [Chlamydiia bacterium]|nr:T9SS type A sorting domain-containing protein [Chlamydiia bacterium]